MRYVEGKYKQIYDDNILFELWLSEELSDVEIARQTEKLGHHSHGINEPANMEHPEGFFDDPYWPTEHSNHNKTSSVSSNSKKDKSVELQKEVVTDRNDIHESDSLFEVVLTEIDADVSTVIHVESITGKTKHRSLRKFNSSGEEINPSTENMVHENCESDLSLEKHKRLGSYKILDAATKKFLVEESIRYGIVETANRYKVSVNNICRWRRSCERKRGAGRKITNLRMEIQLIEWLKGVDRIPLRKEIQESARRLAGEQSGFKASKGWFERFYKRNEHVFLRCSEEGGKIGEGERNGGMTLAESIKMEDEGIELIENEDEEWAYSHTIDKE